MAVKNSLKNFGGGILRLIFNAALYFGLVMLGVSTMGGADYVFSNPEILLKSTSIYFALGFINYLAYDLFSNANIIRKILVIISMLCALLPLREYGVYFNISMAFSYPFSIALKVALHSCGRIFIMFSWLLYKIMDDKQWSTLKRIIAIVLFPIICYVITVLGLVTNYSLILLPLVFVDMFFIARTVMKTLKEKAEDVISSNSKVGTLQWFLDKIPKPPLGSTLRWWESFKIKNNWPEIEVIGTIITVDGYVPDIDVSGEIQKAVEKYLEYNNKEGEYNYEVVYYCSAEHRPM